MEPLKAAIIGGTGYTGAELVRLLHGHPSAKVSLVAGQSRAGQPIASALPSLRGVLDVDVVSFDAEQVAEQADVAFCALPHGASAGIVSSLRDRDLPVIDLSADFRLQDLEAYRAWYGAHLAEARFGQGVYGLPELHREALRSADLIAVPGCYPTATLLAIAPLVKARLVDPQNLVVDAKSGVSGAGRSPTATSHLPECSEGFRAYKVGRSHRHISEIEQELSALAGQAIRITFTPHLVPMTRGLLSTVYMSTTAADVDVEACIAAAQRFYADSPSVVVLDEANAAPDTLWARGSNRAFVSYSVDRDAKRVIAQCAIDNLVKGASGQAVQCMNLRFGLDEAAGLDHPAHWP